MTKPEKEKSLIDLAREHMDNAGANPEEGVDMPTHPATSPERVAQEPAKEAPSHNQTPQASEVFDGTVSDAISDLLSDVKTNTDWRPLELPSRGKAYIESDGFVQIRPFGYAEERKLRSIKKSAHANKVIKALFTACVTGLDYDSMTLEDKNYILFKLREISYGDDYTIKAQCPECDAVNTLTLSISQVPVVYAADDYEEPFKITLPDSKQELVYVSPRCNDEKYLGDVNTLTENLWRFMISIGKYKDERIKREFLKATTVKDLVCFRELLIDNHYGMKKEISYNCAGCDDVVESLIPFTESFFSVN